MNKIISVIVELQNSYQSKLERSFNFLNFFISITSKDTQSLLLETLKFGISHKRLISNYNLSSKGGGGGVKCTEQKDKQLNRCQPKILKSLIVKSNYILLNCITKKTQVRQYYSC